MPSIGWPELLIVLVIALVIFGPKRLPDMGRQLGRGLREFKKATSEIQDHFDLSLEDKDDKDNADVRPVTAAAPVSETVVAQTAAPEAAAAAAPAPEATVAAGAAPAPEATAAAEPEAVEGEVVNEETDHPAQTVAG
jgi:sec-independent protein translocase protein TatA